MKINTIRVFFCLIIISVVISCTGCYSKISNTNLNKAESITFSVSGSQYSFNESDDNFPTIEDTIITMLNSAKFDASDLFSGKVKMPCTDEAVNDDKAAVDIWFEIFIDNGSYKKIFFTMNSNDTQSIWIYATSTDSYSDGKFLKHYSCDCKELLTLLDSYNAE